MKVVPAPAAPPLSRFEKRAWIGLIALSLFLHLARLGTHAFHHDESIHAYASVRLLKEGAYKYDPIYHGPVQYFAVTAAFAVSSVVGKAVGDVKLESEGTADKIEGQVQNAIGIVKDTLKGK